MGFFTEVLGGLQSLHTANFVMTDLTVVTVFITQVAKVPKALRSLVVETKELIKAFKKSS